MKQKALSILIAVIFFLPHAARAQGQQNKGVFKGGSSRMKADVGQNTSLPSLGKRRPPRESGQKIKDLPLEERRVAMDERHKERMDFQRERQKKTMQKLRESLDKNTKLTVEQKKKILEERDQEFQENLRHVEQRYQGYRKFFESVMNDPRLTIEEKNTRLKEYREEFNDSPHNPGDEEKNPRIESQNDTRNE